MSRPLKKDATYADLCAVPENFVAEILGGDLYASPVWESLSSLATSALAVRLMGPFHLGEKGPGTWWLIRRPELHFESDVVVPDIAGWRRERMPTVPDAAFLALAPDWVCEVLSPSTEAIDRSKKLAIYAREGVRNAWLVNPLLQTLEVLRLEAERWSLVAVHGGGTPMRAEPFDSIELPLGVLWTE